MILLREKTYSEQEAERRKRVVVSSGIGAAGLGATAIGVSKSLEKKYIPIYEDRFTNELMRAKDVLSEVDEIKRNGVHIDRVRFTDGYGMPWYRKDNSSGQLERAEGALARFDKAARKGNKKKMAKELGKAEKQAKKAIEYLREDYKKDIAKNKKANMKAGLIGAGGLALTAAGITLYNKKEKKK